MSDVSHRYAACVQHESPLRGIMRGICATQAAAAPLRGILLCCYSHLTCQAPKYHSLCTPRRGSQRPRDRQRSWIQTNPETLTTSSRPGSGGTWRCGARLCFFSGDVWHQLLALGVVAAEDSAASIAVAMPPPVVAAAGLTQKRCEVQGLGFWCWHRCRLHKCVRLIARACTLGRGLHYGHIKC